MIVELLNDLARIERADLEVILTLNLPEDLPVDLGKLPFVVNIIKNAAPKGFAENHNAAFARSEGDYFVVLNPDIRLINDPFDVLLGLSAKRPAAICAPLVLNSVGAIEDSARSFPSPLILLKKLLAKVFKLRLRPEVIPIKDEVMSPDWVAGMFLVIPRPVFAHLHGLSERYHLYYEDVDFCLRARLAGYEILVDRRAQVIHAAQRSSHRKFHYLKWHLQSAFKFFVSANYLKIQMRRLFGS